MHLSEGSHDSIRDPVPAFGPCRTSRRLTAFAFAFAFEFEFEFGGYHNVTMQKVEVVNEHCSKS